MTVSCWAQSCWKLALSYGLLRYMNQYSICFAADRFFCCFWLHWVFVAFVWAFSSCGEQGLLFVAVHRLLIVVACLVEHRLWVHRLQELWHTDLVGPWHVESTGPRDWTYIPSIGKYILIYCTMREVLLQLIGNGCLTFAFEAVLTNKPPNFFKFMDRNNTIILYIL